MTKENRMTGPVLLAPAVIFSPGCLAPTVSKDYSIPTVDISGDE